MSNKIGPEGAKPFGELLKTNNTLTQLVMSDNEMKAEGATALVDGLKSNSDLLSLDVSSNSLGGDVGKLFLPIIDKPHFEVFSGIPIKQIRENSIIELDLKGSKGKQLEACGGVILAHVLTKNSSTQVSPWPIFERGLASHHFERRGTSFCCPPPPM